MGLGELRFLISEPVFTGQKCIRHAHVFTSYSSSQIKDEGADAAGVMVTVAMADPLASIFKCLNLLTVRPAAHFLLLNSKQILKIVIKMRFNHLHELFFTE